MLCDDNKIHLANTAENLQQQACKAERSIEIEAFQNAESLILALTNHEVTADIAILDIHMADTDGISLAKRINQILPNCQIIFLTSYISYVMDVYEAEHAYLVLKDQQEVRLWPAVEHAYTKYCISMRDTILLRSTSGIYTHPLSTIQYFERIGRKTCVHSTVEKIWISDSIEQIVLSGLPEQFYKCHQGFIVNLDYVSSFDGEGYILRNHTRIPVSRSSRKEAKRKLYNQINAVVLNISSS